MDNDSLEQQFLDGFRQFGNMITRASQLWEAKVKSVDEAKYTCVVTVKTGSAETDIYNVPLKVLISTQASFIEIPKIGSICTLLFRHNNERCPQLLHVDECDKILIKVGDSSLKIDSTGFIFNEGENGMVLIDKLITKINKIETALKSHQHMYISAAGTPTPTTPTAAPPPAGTADTTLVFVNTTQSDIENTKIKQ